MEVKKKKIIKDKIQVVNVKCKVKYRLYKMSKNKMRC